jgi:hypothetical protein
MSFRTTVALVALVTCICAALQGQSVKSESLPLSVLKALAKEEREYCDEFEYKKSCHQNFRANLLWRVLVITPSGQDAILVENRNEGFCGLAGCALRLFVQQPDAKFVQVLGMDGEIGTLGSVEVLKTVTNGHYNIQTTWHDGRTFTLYSWGRLRYTARARISESATLKQ